VLLAALLCGVRAPAQEKAPAALVNAIGMELLPVKAGTFLYGAPKETPRPNLWGPRVTVTVTLTKDYHLSRCEVTQTQFRQLMGTNPSRFAGDNLPVDSVTFGEAEEFCRKLSDLPAEKAAGRVYSLPSSAEWEYACRAGSDAVFPWGDEDETKLGTYAWCRDRYGEHSTKTHPVGTKTANAWGFHDMLGNVWEWCADGTWADPLQWLTYYYKKDGWTDPAYPVNPKERKYNLVIRGGGWSSDFRAANSWLVYAQRPLCRDPETGFRVKCVLSAPAAGK
jgi:formylglycine-generating enzyme required for sulfatase activity